LPSGKAHRPPPHGSLIEAIPIAHLTGIPVISIDYRLAPEHPYPAAINDILAVYRGVLERHAPGDIGIYGSSAGRARSAIGGQMARMRTLGDEATDLAA